VLATGESTSLLWAYWTGLKWRCRLSCGGWWFVIVPQPPVEIDCGSFTEEDDCVLSFINPWRACAAKVTVLGLCVCACVCVSVCVSVCVCVCLHLFSPYRDQAGSSVIPTALAQQWLEKYVVILLEWRCSRDMTLKQVTKPPTSMDRYWFRLSGTLAVL